MMRGALALWIVVAVITCGLSAWGSPIASKMPRCEPQSASDLAPAYFMANDNPCEYNSAVVQHFAPNVFLIFSKETDKIYGAAILLGDCKTFLSVSHVFNLPHKGVPATHTIVFENGNDKRKVAISRKDIKAEMTDQTDRAVIKVANPIPCRTIRTSHMSAIELDIARERGAKFYVLKTEFSNNRIETCAQQCRVFSGEASVRLLLTYFIHDCNTEGYQSGSPVVMRSADGALSLVAIHAGGYDSQSKRLHGQDRRDPLNHFELGRRVNYSVPVSQFFVPFAQP